MAPIRHHWLQHAELKWKLQVLTGTNDARVYKFDSGKLGPGFFPKFCCTCALSEKLRNTPMCSICVALTHFRIMWPSAEEQNKAKSIQLTQVGFAPKVQYHIAKWSGEKQNCVGNNPQTLHIRSPPGLIFVGSMLSGVNSSRSLIMTHSRVWSVKTKKQKVVTTELTLHFFRSVQSMFA